MAQKRMFDKALIDTDRFMDLPMSAKALYFLLGMEADDEGFVSYKKVLRIHGGNEDDIKVLTAKTFLIMFESGVVVITDWNKNNWLDSRRIKPTEYKKEKAFLELSAEKEYVLSNGLATAKTEEYSIEENRIEQKRREEGRTPSQIADSFFKGENEFNDILSEFSKNNDPEVIAREFKKFALYWTEPNKSGTRQRWQTEKTFEVRRRLYTWLSNIRNFNKSSVEVKNKYQAVEI